MPVRNRVCEAEERGHCRVVRYLGHTESKLLLQADADEDEADHVDEQVDESGMQPGAGLEPPHLVPVYDLLPVKASILLQPAVR
jgi:hypothetical protein